MNIQELKKVKQQKVDKLIKDCSLFFAFSDEQFATNKTPLKEGEKYVSIGAGGYMPKGFVKAFQDGMKEINKQFKEAVKGNKLRDSHILYELNNHEAYYTGEIEDTLETLGKGYTYEEVMKVFKANRHYKKTK